MKRIFAVDYDDGKVRAKAGAAVPASISGHRQGVLKRAGVIKEIPLPAKVKQPAPENNDAS